MWYLTDDISSFQNGVDTIVNGCTTYGSTPTTKNPNDIVNSIKEIYTNRYNAGGSSQRISYSLLGDQSGTYYCDKAIKVTCSGSMNSGDYGTATVALGSVYSFYTSGNYVGKSISGTYTLPAGSTITLRCTFNSGWNWSNAFVYNSFGSISVAFDISPA